MDDNGLNALIRDKNETIALLRSLLERQEESYRRSLGVLEGEVALLKQAFVEMRTVYERALPRTAEPKAPAPKGKEKKKKGKNREAAGMEPKRFFALMARRGYAPAAVKELIVRQLVEGDERFRFDNGGLWIADAAFEDL